MLQESNQHFSYFAPVAMRCKYNDVLLKNNKYLSNLLLLGQKNAGTGPQLGTVPAFQAGFRRDRSDLAAEQEVIHGEAHPAERQDQDGDEDLADEAVLAVLEDVQHAPDGEDDAEDVDDFC